MENYTSTVPDLSSLPSDAAIPVDAALCSINEFGSCWLIPVSTILTFISVTGNVATFCNILYRRMYKTVTFTCILLLALSDLLSNSAMYLGMFIFFPNMYEYYFNIPLCILSFWAFFTPVLWSSGNLVVLAYERYSLITNPILFHTSHTSCRTLKTSIAILTIISMLNITYAVILSFYKACPDFLLIVYYFAYIAVPIYFLIIGMLLYLHCSKLIKLKRHRPLAVGATKMLRFSEMTTKVYLICLTFVFGQGPFIVNDILVLLTEHNILYPNEELTYLLYQIGTLAMLANYAANPFIYFLSFDRLTSFCKSRHKLNDVASTARRSDTLSSIA